MIISIKIERLPKRSSQQRKHSSWQPNSAPEKCDLRLFEIKCLLVMRNEGRSLMRRGLAGWWATWLDQSWWWGWWTKLSIFAKPSMTTMTAKEGKSLCWKDAIGTESWLSFNWGFGRMLHCSSWRRTDTDVTLKCVAQWRQTVARLLATQPVKAPRAIYDHRASYHYYDELWC